MAVLNLYVVNNTGKAARHLALKSLSVQSLVVILLASILLAYPLQEPMVDILHMFGWAVTKPVMVFFASVIPCMVIISTIYMVYIQSCFQNVLQHSLNVDISVGNDFKDRYDNCLQVLYRIRFHRYALITPLMVKNTATFMALNLSEQ